jgi:hypothetical protein
VLTITGQIVSGIERGAHPQKLDVQHVPWSPFRPAQMLPWKEISKRLFFSSTSGFEDNPAGAGAEAFDKRPDIPAVALGRPSERPVSDLRRVDQRV